MAEKIAIFGGSFNPIHNGHLQVAKSALSECGLKKVIFLPNANPPHKNKEHIISAHHRYNMVALATDGFENFEISNYEMNSDKPSYTINTMRHMKSVYNAELFFIIGADSLYTLNLWKSYKELICECSFIVADRNCTEGSNVSKEAQNIINQGGRVHLLNMPKADVTSTMIREKISLGKDISAYVPKVVKDYIMSNNLYHTIAEDKP